jgi:NAD dependent epimerase/dehydratase family enzyme
VTNKALSQALGRVLKRPTVLPVPGFAVSLLYGQMSELVTGGQRAVPALLQELGYAFSHTRVEDALADVLR